jgi:hypothetical protein
VDAATTSGRVMRVAEPASTGDTSQLYGWLKQREERAYWARGRTLAWTPEQPAYTGTDERLAALRCGEPVNVPLWRCRAGRGTAGRCSRWSVPW